MSYFYMNHRESTSWTTYAVVIVAVLLVGGFVWFHATHKCARYEKEWVRRCNVHRDSEGKRTGETCREREEDVCQEWEER